MTIQSLYLAVLSVLLTVAISVSGATKTWDGGAGTILWHDATNWNPNGVPGNDLVLLDDNAPTNISMTAGMYPNWSTLEITKSDADMAFLVRTMCSFGSPTALNVHPSVPRTYTLASYVNNAAWYGPTKHTWIVDGTGTVFTMDYIGVTDGTGTIVTEWNKKGSGMLSVSSLAFSSPSLAKFTIEGTLDLRYYYGYALIGALPNATVALASNGVLWAQGILVDGWTGTRLPGTGFSGDGTVMLNSALNGTGTRYSLTSAGAQWIPGTTNTTGLLTVNGNLTFTTNGATACTLKIDITGSGTTPGVDFDQLYMSGGDLSGNSLSNMELVVTLAPKTRTAGKTYRIIDDSGNNLAGKTFRTTTWIGDPGTTGDVVGVNGGIELRNVVGWQPRGTAVLLR